MKIIPMTKENFPNLKNKLIYLYSKGWKAHIQGSNLLVSKALNKKLWMIDLIDYAYDLQQKVDKIKRSYERFNIRRSEKS